MTTHDKRKALVRAVRGDITKSGLLSVQYKYEHLKSNEFATLPEFDLGRGDVLGCYQQALEQYDEYLKRKHEESKKN